MLEYCTATLCLELSTQLSQSKVQSKVRSRDGEILDRWKRPSYV